MSQTTPFSITINTVATSVLGQVAQAMSNRSWVELDGTTRPLGTTPNVACTKPAGLAAALLHTSSGGSGHIGTYSNEVVWNPVSRVVEIIGRDHGSTAIGVYARWDVDANSCVWQNIESLNMANHNFDHTQVNPTTGQVYLREYSDFPKIWRFNSGAITKTAITTVPGQGNITGGTAWWSGTMAGAGAQGVYLAYQTREDASLHAFDPLANGGSGSWIWGANGKSIPGRTVTQSGASYQSAMAYSKTLNVAVFGGEGLHTNELWKLDSTGTITKLSNPNNLIFGVHRASVTEDPITGRFIFYGCGNATFWELNPAGTGTWTQLSSPPPGMFPGTEGTPGLMLASMYDPEHQVICYFPQTVSSARLFIYKHGT